MKQTQQKPKGSQNPNAHNDEHQKITTIIDKQINLDPFTQYMLTKGVHLKYVPVIFSVDFTVTDKKIQHATNEQLALYKLHKLYCKLLPSIKLNVSEIQYYVLNYKKYLVTFEDSVTANSIYAIPPLRVFTKRTELDEIHLLKSLTAKTELTKFKEQSIVNTTEIYNSNDYMVINLLNVDSDAPAVICSPYDAPENLYLAQYAIKPKTQTYKFEQQFKIKRKSHNEIMQQCQQQYDAMSLLTKKDQEPLKLYSIEWIKEVYGEQLSKAQADEFDKQLTETTTKYKDYADVLETSTKAHDQTKKLKDVASKLASIDLKAIQNLVNEAKPLIADMIKHIEQLSTKLGDTGVYTDQLRNLHDIDLKLFNESKLLTAFQTKQKQQQQANYKQQIAMIKFISNVGVGGDFNNMYNIAKTAFKLTNEQIQQIENKTTNADKKTELIAVLQSINTDEQNSNQDDLITEADEIINTTKQSFDSFVDYVKQKTSDGNITYKYSLEQQENEKYQQLLTINDLASNLIKQTEISRNLYATVMTQKYINQRYAVALAEQLPKMDGNEEQEQEEKIKQQMEHSLNKYSALSNSKTYILMTKMNGVLHEIISAIDTGAGNIDVIKDKITRLIGERKIEFEEYSKLESGGIENVMKEILDENSGEEIKAKYTNLLQSFVDRSVKTSDISDIDKIVSDITTEINKDDPSIDINSQIESIDKIYDKITELNKQMLDINKDEFRSQVLSELTTKCNFVSDYFIKLEQYFYDLLNTKQLATIDVAKELVDLCQNMMKTEKDDKSSTNRFLFCVLLSYITGKQNSDLQASINNFNQFMHDMTLYEYSLNNIKHDRLHELIQQDLLATVLSNKHDILKHVSSGFFSALWQNIVINKNEIQKYYPMLSLPVDMDRYRVSNIYMNNYVKKYMMTLSKLLVKVLLEIHSNPIDDPGKIHELFSSESKVVQTVAVLSNADYEHTLNCITKQYSAHNQKKSKLKSDAKFYRIYIKKNIYTDSDTHLCRIVMYVE